MKSEKRSLKLLIPAALLLIAFLAFLVIRALFPGNAANETAGASLPGSAAAFRAEDPFGVADLTAEQLTALRRDGTLRLSDGPRGISVGDPLDKILMSYPTDYSGEQPADGQILYCASYFRNGNGVMTALPPRGLLTDDGGRSIVITLLSPTMQYPEGTADNYLQYEHVFCRYTVDPETMTVSSIVLGLDS